MISVRSRLLPWEREKVQHPVVVCQISEREYLPRSLQSKVLEKRIETFHAVRGGKKNLSRPAIQQKLLAENRNVRMDKTLADCHFTHG